MDTVRKTIGEIFFETALRRPNGDAVVHLEVGARYNYALLAWEVERAARGFLRLGIGPGEAVAIWGVNVPEWIIAFLAAARIGAVSVPVDPGAGHSELAYILSNAQCRCLVAYVEEEETLQTALKARDDSPELSHIVVIGEQTDPDTMLWSEFTAKGSEVEQAEYLEAASRVKADDPVAIMYTSGTTGRPKGVVLDHLGLVNKSLHSAARQRIDESDRLCLSFPLFHMFGNTCIAIMGLIKGSTLVMPSKVFQPQAVVEGIKKEACTAVFGSPSMLRALLDHPFSTKKAWKTVKKGTVGGAPCPSELMKRIVEDVGVSGLVSAYGITEASSWITMTEPDDPIERRTSTIGKALPCCEVKIVDPRTGENIPAGRQGELCTRGFLMKGYHKLPVATSTAVDKEGWFHTGDLGEIDEQGYVRITGRLKDVIKRMNEEILPVELEEILYGLDGVSEVQVFGFPDPEMGQEVAAWVKVREGSDLTLEDLCDFSRKSIPEAKRPHYFKIVSGFPTTRSGKVQKFKLAEMAAEEYGRQGDGAQPLYTCS
jgi:fatty-acyl-CoA synthase